MDALFRGTNPGPIGVTTFVSIDDLNKSSTFGRVYSEQVMNELAMRGFDIVELRHADAIQILGSGGEFGLSRDLRSIRKHRDLGAIVVGTYTASPDTVYVNARLINPTNSLVLSAGSVEFPRTAEVARLLRDTSGPRQLERIPVRHLLVDTVPLYGPVNPQAAGWAAEETETPSPKMMQVPGKRKY